MTCYLPEPTTAAEVIARARASAARNRLPPSLVRPAARPSFDQRYISTGMQQAHAVLEDLARHHRIVPDLVRQIVSSVAVEYEVRARDIFGRSHRQIIYAARRAAMIRVREATDASLPQIGRWFGRDHTSVLHAIRDDAQRDEKHAYARRQHNLKREAERAHAAAD